MVSVKRWSCSRGVLCGGVHYGEVEGVVSVERWPCSRDVLCGGVHYGEVEGVVSVERWSCYRDPSCVVECTHYQTDYPQLLSYSLTVLVSPPHQQSPAVVAFGPLSELDGNPLQLSSAFAHSDYSIYHL